MTGPIALREQPGFQMAPLPAARSVHDEEREQELRSRERCTRITRIAGLIITGVGFLGACVIPVIGKSVQNEKYFGESVLASFASIGVACFGLWFADNNSCCNHTGGTDFEGFP